MCVILFNNIFTNSFDHHQFATSLYHQINKPASKNIIFSPISAQTALTLTMFGATGETKYEMKAGMHYGNSTDEEILKKYDMVSKLLNTYSSVLKIINKIYVASGYSLKQTFKDIAVKLFNSEAQRIFVSIKHTIHRLRSTNGWRITQ